MDTSNTFRLGLTAPGASDPLHQPRAPTLGPEHPAAALADALRARVQENPALEAAAQLIEQLQCRSPLPDNADEHHCQQAADLLLQLKAPDLLLQLAQLRPMAYVLNVGAHEARAGVLAAIGDRWPADRPALLVLSTALPHGASHTLHAFLLQAAPLDVQIVAEAAQDADTLLALAQALRLRPLKALSIVGAAPTEPMLRLLVGVQAAALHVKIQPLNGEDRDPFERAMIALVRACGATSLQIADDGTGGPLAAKLLRCRRQWQVVHVGVSIAVCDELRKGRVRIDKLVFHTPGHMVSAGMGLLKRLHASGVKTLVVHGGMNLLQLAANLEAHSTAEGFYLQRMEACFMLPHGADLEPLFAALERSGRIGAWRHRPMKLAGKGYAPLSDGAAARLAVLASRPRGPVRTKPSPEEWQGAAQALAGLLAPARSVQEVIGLLIAPGHRLIPTVDLSATVLGDDRTSVDLADKLEVLLAAEVSDGLLRAAMALHLQDHPDQKHLLLQTLVDLRFPLSPHKDHWQALARGFARPPFGAHTNPTLLGLVRPSETSGQQAPATARPPSALAPRLRAHEALAAITGGAQGAAQLLQHWTVRNAALAGDPQQVVAHAAVKAILGLLTGRSVNFARMTHEVLDEFANELLRRGQWPLLRRLVPTHPRWMVNVTTPAIAHALEKMAPWPAPQQDCYVTVSTALPGAAVEQVHTFVQSVTPEKLRIRIFLRPSEHATVWAQLARMVLARPGLDLMLECSQNGAFPTQEAVTLLENIRHARMGRLVLTHLPENATRLSQALIDTIRSANIDTVGFDRCSASSLRDILPCRPWKTVHFLVSAEAVQPFCQSRVKAQTLSLHVPRGAAGAITSLQLESLVAACADLQQLEIQGMAIGLRTLARLLRSQPALHTVKCVPSMGTREEAEAALASMRQHAAIQHFDFASPETLAEPDAPGALDPDIFQALRDLATRHRLRDPQRMAWGAGKGFLWGWHGGRAAVDPGEIIGDGLDPRSALALALSSQTAYSAALNPWNERIDALATGLAPGTSFQAFVRMLDAWVASGLLDGAAPRRPSHASLRDNLVLNKVIAMGAAGLPQDVQVEAVGRRLHQLTAPGPETKQRRAADLDTMPHLLEALALLGAMPASEWLRKGLGIDPQAPGFTPVPTQAAKAR